MADREDLLIAIRYALLKKGAKQKFSLFFLISLSILVITLDRFSLPFILSTRAVLNDLVYKVTVVVSAPGKFLNHLGKVKTNHLNIVSKNKILKEEIRILKSEQYDSIFLKTENKYLKKTLSIDNATTDIEDIVISAKVILDQESPYLKSLLVNKGRKHGIIKGMSVFSKGYLIGRIIESNFLTARILLVTDLNSKIPVIIQDTNINAILTGKGKKRDLDLDYLPDEFILEAEKVIYTSGKDGFIKPGLLVAKTYLNKKNEIKIKSLADPKQALIIQVTNGQLKR